MSLDSVTDMDVDSPATPLKRSSSAPMINDISNSIMTTSPSTSSARENANFNVFSPVSHTRARRFSASFSSHLGSPVSGPRVTPRINQIRQEECAETSNLREMAHERNVHCAMQISQSWEDLTLVPSESLCKSDTEMKTPKDGKMGPLHLNLSPYAPSCSSPSPTRSGLTFPNFSPTLQAAMKLTLSPSPTRRPSFMTRRSLSPIAMRPSALGPVKRKLEDDKFEPYGSPRAKRFNSYSERGGGLLIAHNNTSSPLPGSLSSVGTPESLSSADSPGYSFRAIDSPSPSRPMQVSDEPMNEERSSDESSRNDQIMTSVDRNSS